ncbi:hypothetical protein B0O80DRAFT_507024 [Mortierella sp. GBAus27b]|nr:hypothetical protein B0O80DRAFT_507024 [Mortierella sp. GBAus27b]
MVFGHVISSSRGSLSLHQLLELANAFLGSASKVQDRGVVLELCHEAEVTLSQAKKLAKRSEDKSGRQRIALAYIGLGKVLENYQHPSEAADIYKRAEKLGVNVQEHLAQSLDPRNNTLSADGPMGSTVDNSAPGSITLTPPKKGGRQGNDIIAVPPHIFSENVAPATIVNKLPDPDERLTSTPQLACCLGILKESRSLGDLLQPEARKWVHVVENDEDEQERLKVLATDVIRTFKKDEIKDARSVSEVVCLAPVLDKDLFRDLLMEFYKGIDHSGLLDFYQVEGLAQMIQGANPGHLHADDLVRILRLLATRLRETHQQSPQHMYHLTLAASYVLDAMADTHVEGLDRETLHEPLLSYLDSLKGSSDPFLIYQAAYAYQALLCVPDNETLWQATFRRAGKVIKGVSGLVSAVKGFDLSGFIDGLKDIQTGLAGASDVIKVVITTMDDVKSLTSGAKGFLDGLKEGFSFQRKCAWYPALRGADSLLRDGELVAFKQLVCEAPCRLDPAFQWGVCQRLGEIAISSTWDTHTRRGAIAFLGEMYLNNDAWGDQQSTKEWILTILIRVTSSKESTSQDRVTNSQTTP